MRKIKLVEILRELDKPSNIYAPGKEPEDTDDDFIHRGFKLTNTTVNPDTGTTTSLVHNLPQFALIRHELLKTRKEFQPYKFSSNPDIANLAKQVVTAYTKLSALIFALDKMVELGKKS